jgi:Family of unknown function (DUF6186)
VSSRAVTVLGYVVLVLAGVVLEAASRRKDSPIPSLRQVVRRVMSSRSGRVGVMAGWAWLGLHFFAR